MVDHVVRIGGPWLVLEARPALHPRVDAFPVRAAVFTDNAASNRYTVVEVNARDRPALLSALAGALLDAEATVHSAHIATYGERAVDVFYLTGPADAKIAGPAQQRLEAKLLAAAAESNPDTPRAA